MTNNIVDGFMWLLTISVFAWAWFMWKHGGK